MTVSASGGPISDEETIRKALWHLNMMEPRFRQDMFPAFEALDRMAPVVEAARVWRRAVRDTEKHNALDAAVLVAAYHDAGGQEWWDAHAKLYAALVSAGYEISPAAAREALGRLSA